MKLSNIIKNCDTTLIQGTDDIEITGITDNSKEVEPGNLFIAYKGTQVDGHKFIPDAIKNGVSALLVQDIPEDIPSEVSIIKTDNTRKIAGIVADNFYDHPSSKLTMIGLTGTKGKTSTLEMIRSILTTAGHNVGVCGTLGIFYNDKKVASKNTTPDSLLLHKVLKDMVENGIDTFVMEASSQGFKMHRTNGINFDVGVLMNIDQDHIGENEHKDFEEYLNCKLMLLDQANQMVINKADQIWDFVDNKAKEKALSFSAKSNDADYYSENPRYINQDGQFGCEFDVKGKFNQTVNLKIPGHFNISNALAAITVCDYLRIDQDSIVKGLANVKVPGRSESVDRARKFNRNIFLDFAHNRLSIKTLLEDLKAYKPNKIVALFSCLHDETELRRHDMGITYGENADLTILTTGTLGDFTFEEVNDEIIKALDETGGKYKVIPERKEAIEYALKQLDENDILVLLIGDNNNHGKTIPEYDFLNEKIEEIYA